MGKVGIIGHYGGKNEFLDGQTVRTKIMTEELKNHFKGRKFVCVDTFNYRKRALLVLLSTVYCIFSCKDIIVILSRNGCNFFYPLLYFCSKLFGIRVYNNLIGGGNEELFANKPEHIKYCNSFKVNWVQLDKQKYKLEKLGLRNVESLPNAKRLTIVNKDQLSEEITFPLKFCTFSRVSKSKGIELAAKTIMEINKEAKENLVELDIYGQLDKDYKEEFLEFQKQFTSEVRYRGIIPFNKSTDVLKDYYALLFPTTFYGEGFPGTIIDAFSAGIPVIATNWNYNNEVITDGKTGWIYDFQKPEQLKEFILRAVKRPTTLMDMKKQCIEEAYNYTPDKVLPIIYKWFERKGV
jgi:glycosyltransferase involved in cell wall biosynthesis